MTEQHGKRPDNNRPMSYVLLTKYGIGGALRILYKDVWFDIRHGVDTAAPASQHKLFGDKFSDEQHRYVASTFDVMNSTLEFAARHIDLTQCEFLDLGSGKGKALIAASEFPFRSLRGVELSAMANTVARKNLQKLDLESRIELVQGSAADCVFRADERVVYFFNSFSGATLESVLQNLMHAPRSGPGMLIYVNPTEYQHVERYFDCMEHGFVDPGQCEIRYYSLPASPASVPFSKNAVDKS